MRTGTTAGACSGRDSHAQPSDTRSDAAAGTGCKGGQPGCLNLATVTRFDGDRAWLFVLPGILPGLLPRSRPPAGFSPTGSRMYEAVSATASWTATTAAPHRQVRLHLRSRRDDFHSDRTAVWVDTMFVSPTADWVSTQIWRADTMFVSRASLICLQTVTSHYSAKPVANKPFPITKQRPTFT